jgi:predicted nucleic acid-binding protein
MDALLSRLQLGRLELLLLDATDVSGIGSILEKYRDQNLQLADACLMYLSNRERINTVFTLDHRDFAAFRAQDGNALNLLPAPW